MKKGLLVSMLMVAVSAAFAEPQTTCPVMGGSINPKLYVDAAGYRIYVCCGGCVSAVKKDPEKYIKKMQSEGIELEEVPKTQK